MSQILHNLIFTIDKGCLLYHVCKWPAVIKNSLSVSLSLPPSLWDLWCQGKQMTHYAGGLTSLNSHRLAPVKTTHLIQRSLNPVSTSTLYSKSAVRCVKTYRDNEKKHTYTCSLCVWENLDIFSVQVSICFAVLVFLFPLAVRQCCTLNVIWIQQFNNSITAAAINTTQRVLKTHVLITTDGGVGGLFSSVPNW